MVSASPPHCWSTCTSSNLRRYGQTPTHLRTRSISPTPASGLRPRVHSATPTAPPSQYWLSDSLTSCISCLAQYRAPARITMPALCPRTTHHTPGTHLVYPTRRRPLSCIRDSPWCSYHCRVPLPPIMHALVLVLILGVLIYAPAAQTTAELACPH